MNENLAKAKNAKNDEFYTQLPDIERELTHYREHFRGEVVYCNCDDPFESKFFQYFSLNFKELGLKRLITTGYAGRNGDSGSAFRIIYDGEQDGNNMPDYSHMDKTTILCPECNSKMHKMGKTWSGRRQVQRYRCPKCGRTYAPVKKVEL